MSKKFNYNLNCSGSNLVTLSGTTMNNTLIGTADDTQPPWVDWTVVPGVGNFAHKLASYGNYNSVFQCYALTGTVVGITGDSWTAHINHELSFWIRFDDLANGMTNFDSFHVVGGANVLNLHFGNGQITAGSASTNIGSYAVNQWVHVLVVITAQVGVHTTYNWYIDGALELTEVNGYLGAADLQWYSGSVGSNSSVFFAGFAMQYEGGYTRWMNYTIPNVGTNLLSNQKFKVNSLGSLFYRSIQDEDRALPHYTNTAGATLNPITDLFVPSNTKAIKIIFAPTFPNAGHSIQIKNPEHVFAYESAKAVCQVAGLQCNPKTAIILLSQVGTFMLSFTEVATANEITILGYYY